jgi:transposase
MRAYGLDLRERIVEYVTNGGKTEEAARHYKVALCSVYRYLRASEQEELAPQTSWGRGGRKLDEEQLKARVKQCPDATLHELAAYFQVSHNAVWVRLRQLGYTLKKTRNLSRAQPSAALTLSARTGKKSTKPVYCLDQCGVDHRLYREYGRAPRGEKLCQAVSGAKRGRTGVMAVCCKGKLVAPLVFTGTCDTALMNAYLSQVLLPVLPTGSVIVLDNARFHQAASTRELVAQAGCELLFLPPYSPDLNPIEHLWASLKKLLQPLLPNATNHFNIIAKTSLSLC